MPSGRTHKKLTTITAIVAAPAIFFDPTYIPFVVGILATLPVFIRMGDNRVAIYFNPDMDILKNRSSTLAKVWGLDAYEQLVRHRSGLRWSHWKEIPKAPLLIFGFSHLPGIGTGFRTLMLLIPVAIIMLSIFGVESEIWHYAGQWALMIWLGMSLSDSVHAVADLVVHFWKGLYGNKNRQSQGRENRRTNFVRSDGRKYAPGAKGRARRNVR